MITCQSCGTQLIGANDPCPVCLSRFSKTDVKILIEILAMIYKQEMRIVAIEARLAEIAPNFTK